MDEEEESERGPDGYSQFVRSLVEDPVFVKQTRLLFWTAHACFDEDKGTEVLWLKIRCEGHSGAVEDDSASIQDVWQQLQAWKALDHSMLLRCALSRLAALIFSELPGVLEDGCTFCESSYTLTPFVGCHLVCVHLRPTPDY